MNLGIDPTATVPHPSLPEVHGSVATGRLSRWRKLWAFFGPAYLVSVGYMDPGNWATDLEGGARFGYQLLWVLVMSNAMAILLQTLAARLGVVSGRDLAQACRESYPRPVVYALWILCEIAIAACDLAELLGAAIALKLLFGIPLLWGVLLTAGDTLAILLLSRFGIRTLEAVILVLVATIGVCMGAELWLAKPVISEVLSGLRPHLTGSSLYVAIGILGATVMPHNLYLHSALVQTRRFGDSDSDKRTAVRYNLWDSVVALNVALFVNASILILAAAVFFKQGIAVTQIEQAHQLLSPLLGTTAASILFALALLAAGQSSTITGTMAGQIVMEGFLSFRMSPWLRRFITRLLAVTPAALMIWLRGDGATFDLLILSQVVLSMQLPFAVIPLLHFTGDRRRMGEFANGLWVRVLGWVTAAIIVGLNLKLVFETLRQAEIPELAALVIDVAVVAVLLLLAWITMRPLLPASLRFDAIRRFALTDDSAVAPLDELVRTRYCRILVPVDHSDMDRVTLLQAAALAKQDGATVILVHVEEGVTSQVYGSLASTAEVEQGRDYLTHLVGLLVNQGIASEALIRHGRRPAQEIIRAVHELQPDIVIMGAHGHTGIKDLIFGNTINKVRHSIHKPLLIVRAPEVKPS